MRRSSSGEVTGLEVRAGHAVILPGRRRRPRPRRTVGRHARRRRRPPRPRAATHGDQEERLVRAELVGERTERERRDADREARGQASRAPWVASGRCGAVASSSATDSGYCGAVAEPGDDEPDHRDRGGGRGPQDRPAADREDERAGEQERRGDPQGQRADDEPDHRHPEHEPGGRRGGDARAGVGLLDHEARGPVGRGELHGDRRDERGQEAPGGQGAAADGCARPRRAPGAGGGVRGRHRAADRDPREHERPRRPRAAR